MKGIFTAARTDSKIWRISGQVAEEAGAAVALHYFFCGTAEVEIDQVEAEIFDEARGVGQDAGIAAEELGGDGMLVFVEVQVASANALIAEDAVGGGELGHDQAASAEIFDEAAEDGVGDSGHRGQDGGGRDADVAYGEGRGEGARGGFGLHFRGRQRRSAGCPRTSARFDFTWFDGG